MDLSKRCFHPVDSKSLIILNRKSMHVFIVGQNASANATKLCLRDLYNVNSRESVLIVRMMSMPEINENE